MLVELVEILKLQHAAELAAAQDEIQLLKSKLFQQSSQPVLPSAQPVPSAPIKAALPPSTPVSSPSKGQFLFFLSCLILLSLFFSFLFLFLFDSSLTHSFSFIFSGLSQVFIVVITPK